MKRALVTGATGFVGTHLIKHLTSLGWEVAGYDRHVPSEGAIPYFIGNIDNEDSLSRALQEFQPKVIFHLAGILKSEKPKTFYNVHVLGVLTLFESIIEAGLHPHVMIASSSAVYGAGRGRIPITESVRPHPVTHYAVSKLAQEMIALRYYNSHGLPVTCVRTFNLLGAGLSTDMAPSAFAKQIAYAEKIGKPAQIFTGDLSAQRDYTDVRDAVRAYSLIAEHGIGGQVYNVCSGKPFALRTILKGLLHQAKVPIEVELDPARVQKNDIPFQVGSAKKLHTAIHWQTRISMKQSLVYLLNDWRKRILLEKIE